MLHSNPRTVKIPEAPIQKLLAEAKIPENTVSLGQGVPFFPPPPEAIAAFGESARKEGFRYSEDAGIPALREAIKNKLREENKIRCDIENIMVTAGGNQAFINALLAITSPGDEIILIAPYYFNHLMAIELAGCKAVVLPPSEKFIPDVEKIEEKISERTRAIVTVSPNNPAGVVYPPELLARINKLCAEHGIYHISDEAYEHFVFEEAVHQSPAKHDAHLEHTISLFSFSKSFGMGGYRVGYMVFPASLFPEILKVQDTIGICPPVPSQYAALSALKFGKRYPEMHLSKMETVRRLFLEELKKLDVKISQSNGAFYVYIRLPKKGKRIDDWTLAIQLIEKFGVIVIPGSVFGDKNPGFRISFGNVDKRAGEEGIKRFVEGLSALCPWVR